MIVFLTDTRRWQFFRIIRLKGNEFKVEESSKFLDGEGWTIYLSLLMVPLEEIGYSEMNIKEVEAMELVGVGRQFVFSGNFRGEVGNLKVGAHSDFAYVFKVFSDDNDTNGDFDREENNLQLLLSLEDDGRGVVRKHLPRLVRSNLVTEESCLRVLVMAPLALKVKPCVGGFSVCGRHILQLFDVVEYVHKTIHLVHRDIKPDNIFLSRDEQNILLNDWGSASTCGEEVPYQGTYGFSDRPSSPLGALFHVPAFKDDLVAVVRSAFLMLFDEPAPIKSHDVEEFWTRRFANRQFWESARD